MTDVRETSRVLTLVFTDLADSTALKTQHGDVAVGDLISRHREHVTRIAAESSGRIIDWAGDGCFLTFETSSAAVLFALRVQQVHADEPDLPGVRIGVHMGEVTEKPGPEGDEKHPRIEGLAVDIAARISGLTKPGQVLMSSSVYNSARQRMGVEALGMPLLWQLHGTYALKGFDTPLDIAEAGLKGIAPLEAPKVGDKARLVRKAKRQPEVYKESSGQGVPVWAYALTVMVLMGVIVYLFLGRPPGPGISTSVDTPIRSLAVLPFDNLMGDDTKEYFVDGMTDTLTAELSKIASIKVIARTSAMKFKNSDEPLSEIARQLGVEGLIEGSIQQFGDEIRITAQLIDGRTEAHLWAENFTGTLAGVMKLQGEVAVAIADQIGAVLTPEEREEYAEAKDVNPEAYDLYLQGRGIMQGRTESDFQVALDLFEKALSLDPQFALPHAGMADVYSLAAGYYFYSFVTRDEAIEKAFEHAGKAVKLDDSLADAHVALGWALTSFDADRNWSTAEREFQRAIALNPGLARARYRYGWLLVYLGRNMEALREMRRASELDPLDPLAATTLGFALQYAGQYDDAVEAMLSAIEMDPSLSAPYGNLSFIYRGLGRPEEALKFARKGYDISKSHSSEWGVIFFGAAVEGIDALRALVAEVEQGKHDHRLLDGRAALYFAVGDTDKALRDVQKNIQSGKWSALRIRSTTIITSFESDPAARRRLDDDPRFWEILDQYNLPPLPPDHPRYAKEQAHLRRKAAKEALAALPKPVRRLSISLAEGETLRQSRLRDYSVAISPDGSRVAYVGMRDGESRLMLRAMDQLHATDLPGTEGATQPTFSPDGQSVAFYANGFIKQTRIQGNLPVNLYQAPVLLGMSWGDDGTIVFSQGVREPLRRLRPGSDQVEILTELVPGEGIHGLPHVLPGSKAMLFVAATSPEIANSNIELFDFATKERRVLIRQATRPHYVSSGHIVVAQEGRLAAVRFDLTSLQTEGEPYQIAGDAIATNALAPRDFAISKNGTLVYGQRSGEDSRRKLVWVDDTGREEALGTADGPYFSATLSPDGGRAVIMMSDLANIYVQDLTRTGAPRQLTFGSGRSRFPVWTADGKRIVYAVVREDSFTIEQRPADGSGSATVVATYDQATIPHEISPDGKTLLVVSYAENTGQDILAVPMERPESMRPLFSGVANETQPDLSPDGKWIAYVSDELGQSEIFVRPYPGLEGKWKISSDGGTEPTWAHDGETIFYRSGDSMMAVSIDTSRSFVAGEPRELFVLPYLFNLPTLNFYDRSPVDDRFLVITRGRQTDVTTELVVVENWFEEVKRSDPNRSAD